MNTPERGASSSLTSEVALAVGLWRIWLRLGLRDLRRRFRRTSIGISWIFVHLAITVFAVGFVYANLFGRDMDEFLPALTIGLIVWVYLTSVIVEGGNALIGSEGYITQIGLPPYLYILRSYVSTTAVMLLSLVAYSAVALVFRVGLGLGTILAIPGILLLMCVGLFFTAIMSQVAIRWRDMVQLAAVGMQVIFYVTPVLWPAEIVIAQGKAWIVDLNPFYHLLEVVRRPLLYSQRAAGTDYVATLLVIAILVFLSIAITRRFHRRLVYWL